MIDQRPQYRRDVYAVWCQMYWRRGERARFSKLVQVTKAIDVFPIPCLAARGSSRAAESFFKQCWQARLARRNRRLKVRALRRPRAWRPARRLQFILIGTAKPNNIDASASFADFSARVYRYAGLADARSAPLELGWCEQGAGDVCKTPFVRQRVKHLDVAPQVPRLRDIPLKVPLSRQQEAIQAYLCWTDSNYYEFDEGAVGSGAPDSDRVCKGLLRLQRR